MTSSSVKGRGKEFTMSPSTPIYQIYALKYAGPFTRPMAKVLWNTDWEKETYVNYYFWVVKGNGEILVVDGGMTPGLAQNMKLVGYVNPVDVLKRIGIDAFQIKKLIITHMNFDHLNGIELFPNATFYVQEREFNFWVKDPIAQKPPFLMMSDPAGNGSLAKLEGTERLILVQGDQEILPGIEVLLAPGHSPGLQVVAVNTARGRAIVGSDCAHIFANYEKEIPSCFIIDLVAWMKTYEKIKSKASSLDLIFPGHDIKMLTDYPRVAEDVTLLA